MKSATKLRVMCLIFGLGVIQAKPLEDSEVKRASRPPIGETIQQLTNQLIDQNSTMPNTTITLDTRTPPRVKQHMKNHHKLQPIVENSHPGMAIPADENEFDLHLQSEEVTKKATIYKLEMKPTTEKGLSTWVLLNSQTVSPSTVRPTIKPIIKLTTKINERNSTFSTTATESSYKSIKPFFKKRPATTTTTRKPSTTTKMVMPITKVKFSVLQSVKNKTQSPMSTTATTSSKTTLTSTTTSMTLVPSSSSSSTTITKATTTTMSSPLTKTTNITKHSTEVTSTTALPAEAKQGEVELTTTTTDVQKKNRKSPPKKKKNKNRRRRPSSGEKSGNVTEIAEKIGHNNSKPIGTQIYNYLSREIMPTVGVGLVGLMVTAGLASYFLYPFGTLRRSYEIERKDVKGSYYYDNDYSVGGVAEEDMISKVVAGMQDNQGLDMLVEKDNFYKKTDKNEKANVRTSNDRHKSYRDTIDAYVPQNNYGHFDEDIKVQPEPSDNSNSIYNNNKQFVVGAITKKILEVTPAAVPEHGPRSLSRRKRSKSNNIENEIHNYQANEITSDENTEKVNDLTTTLLTTLTDDSSKATTEKSTSSSEKNNESSSLPPCSSTTKQTEIYKPADASSIMQILRDLIELKIKLGLEMMRNTTMTISRYFHEVQKKFESRRKRH